MHPKKDDSAKAGKTSSRSSIVPVTVPSGGATAYIPPTVNAKPAPHELTPADKTAVKKASANAPVHGEKDFTYLASQSQILRASHVGFSQISQSSTPMSCTPRHHPAAPHPAAASIPRTQTEYSTWTMVDRTSSEKPREAERPRKFEDDKLHKMCQLVTLARTRLQRIVLLNELLKVTLTAGTVSRENLDDLMSKIQSWRCC
jgi:hypothetical protein